MQSSRTIVVRKMNLSDVDAVHEIENLSITPPWSKQGFVDGLANENADFYVAEAIEEVIQNADSGSAMCDSKKRVVGYCGLYFAADEGEITNVAVLPKCRGNGIADQILTAAFADAREKGLAQIFLEVRASNIPAQKLYEKHGFVSCGIRKNFYREPKEDAIVMMLSL